MFRERIKDAGRAILVGGIWLFLVWVGFLAKEYDDDILLGAYIVAGATALSALIGWFLMDN